jgi:RNA polymerase sigma-70 factor (ECF subfamily)
MATAPAAASEPLAPAKLQRGGRDETQLLADLRRGDRVAAEVLVELTYPLVYRSLYRMCGDGDAASDLTQETYARAWRALDQFDGRSRFSTWLYRIAYTTFLNHVRRPQRFVSLDDESVAPGLAVAVEQDPISGADAARLRRAVLALPEELRSVVAAHFWGEVPVRDIARQEGLSGVGVRKRLRRAITRLRAELGEDGP